MKFKFTANVVIEATSEEDALNRVGGRISAIARHLANERTLDECQPFFTLTADAKGSAVDLAADPIAEARREAEAEAAAAELAAKED